MRVPSLVRLIKIACIMQIDLLIGATDCGTATHTFIYDCCLTYHQLNQHALKHVSTPWLTKP